MTHAVIKQERLCWHWLILIRLGQVFFVGAIRWLDDL